MADKRTLRPQVPGATTALDPNADASLAPLFDLDDVDVISGLSALDDAELNRLGEMAVENKRGPINNAVKAEQTKRTEAEAAGYTRQVDPSLPQALPQPPAQPASEIYGQPAHVGDSETYSKFRQEQIDPSTLTGPVLTRDGWVVPSTDPNPIPVAIVPMPGNPGDADA